MAKICEEKKNTRTVECIDIKILIIKNTSLGDFCVLTSSDFASVIDLLSLVGSWMCLLRPPPTRGRTLQNTLMLPCFVQRKESDK